MFDLFVLFVVLASLFIYSYSSGSYVPTLIAGVSFLLSLVNAAPLDRVSGTDELDVLPGVWIFASTLAVLACVIGAGIGRRAGHGRRS